MALPMQIGLWFLAGINALSFLLFAADKLRAQRGLWRVSERMLFLLAAFGGSAGAILAMWVFRHKTRHWRFVPGLPAMLAVQVALCLWAHMRLF